MGIEFNSLSFYMYHIQTTVIELNSSSFSSSFHFQIGMWILSFEKLGTGLIPYSSLKANPIPDLVTIEWLSSCGK